MERFTMKQVSVRITGACNLNCALCAAHVPYRKSSSAQISFNCLERSLSKLFEIVDYVEKFTITGGEPLLYPGLADYIVLLRQYVGQMGTIQIISNGSIVPGEALLYGVEKLGKEKVSFLVDNYGDQLSTKIQEIRKIFDKANIRYEVRNYHGKSAHCNGWVDFGDLSQKKRDCQEDIEALYAKCAYPQKMHFCFLMNGGMMHPCAPSEMCHEYGVTPDNGDEYIDLLDDTLTIEEQRQKLRRIYEGKSLAACAYCNGMCEDSQRYTPAVQLTVEELHCVKNGARSYQEVCAMLCRERT